MLLNSLSLLIDMVRFANLAIRIAVGSEYVVNYLAIVAAVSTIFRLILCAAILTNLVHHCEMVYRQNNKIICISDYMLNFKNPEPKLREAITELKTLIQSRPITFHMANFIRLDYAMLMSTASVVVTYTIILLQSLN
ncbi:uncharacterized protein LOC114351188 isoform X2 [Ostrinia furnacalis]|nr:uncharacterized protein LOC114351188 isoform X2 [Ostrinia furnacalis]